MATINVSAYVGGARSSGLIETGLKFFTEVQIIFPYKLADVMHELGKMIPDPSLEYGLYLKGKIDDTTGHLIVSDEYYLPEQEVTAGSIRFIEEPPSAEWNVIIHRHPNSCTSFSATDKDSINQEFLASLLFIQPASFPAAVVNLPLGHHKVQVPGRVVVSRREVPAGLEAMAKAKIVRHVAPVVNRSGTAVVAVASQAVNPTPGGSRQEYYSGGNVATGTGSKTGGSSINTAALERDRANIGKPQSLGKGTVTPLGSASKGNSAFVGGTKVRI